jgi:glutaminase
VRTWQYRFLLTVGLICVGLSVAIVVLNVINQRLQQDMQARQRQLSGSVLGQQGQAIANTVLQDMAAVATTNTSMSKLLARHGFSVNSGTAVETNDTKTATSPARSEP